MNKEKKWIIRAKETHNFHAEKKKKDNDWRIADTAKALKRSNGSICEDMLVAKWLRTHALKLSEFKYLNEAIDWIRNNEHKLLEMKIE